MCSTTVLLLQLLFSQVSQGFLLTSSLDLICSLITVVLRLLISSNRNIVSQFDTTHNLFFGPFLLLGIVLNIMLGLVDTAILFLLVGFLDPDHALGLGERALKLLDSSILFTVFFTLLKSKPLVTF